jgi:hypothetical protein
MPTVLLKHPRIVLLGSHERQLQEYFSNRPNGSEGAAIGFFRLISREVQGLELSERYLCVDVALFQDSWIISASPKHLDFEMAPLREFFRRAEEEDLILSFIHNHPTPNIEFSFRDHQNELTLLKALIGRNGKTARLIALLYSDGAWAAHLRYGSCPESIQPVRHVTAIGESFKVFGTFALGQTATEIFQRQLTAFGAPFTSIMQSLRFAVVGAGGTGSPIANLLVRSGAGEIILIDEDRLEKTNLNRVIGSCLRDVGKQKAELIEQHLNEIELPTTITSVIGLIDNNMQALSALSTADVVLGCTDDYLRRDILNSSVYYYLNALIDVGLGGRVGQDRDGTIRLLNQKGRISRILPEDGKCLYCQRELRSDWLTRQLEIRNKPDITDRELHEKYLSGGKEQAPGVAPFTGTVANLAMTTLFDLLAPYRRIPGELRRDNLWVDFTKMEFKSDQPIEDPECPYCGTRIFLAKPETDGLLGRPIFKM